MDIVAIISAIPPSAIPIVVVILGLGYLYFKFGQEKKDREVTKAVRNKDSQEIHDTLLRHTFQIDELKGQNVHHEQVLDDLNKQMGLLNTNIVKLQVTIENMGKK